MGVEETYRKDKDGQVYFRRVETKEDVNGTMFTVTDKEISVNHESRLNGIEKELLDLREEIAELQVEETRLVSHQTRLKAAIDGR